jgi:hypothetical protein
LSSSTTDPTSLFRTRDRRRRRSGADSATDWWASWSQLRDPEGVARVDHDGEIFLIAASSLCVAGTNRSDGLVRARHTPHGDLNTEAMQGFRAWLLSHEPWLAASADKEPDANGLNIEGLAWDSGGERVLFAAWARRSREITVIRVPVDAATAPGPHRARNAIDGPHPHTEIDCHTRIRDISRQADWRLSDFSGDQPAKTTHPSTLHVGRQQRQGQAVDVEFHRSMKPAVTMFGNGDRTRSRSSMTAVLRVHYPSSVEVEVGARKSWWTRALPPGVRSSPYLLSHQFAR